MMICSFCVGGLCCVVVRVIIIRHQQKKRAWLPLLLLLLLHVCNKKKAIKAGGQRRVPSCHGPPSKAEPFKLLRSAIDQWVHAADRGLCQGGPRRGC
jgi:hypothetical protein